MTTVTGRLRRGLKLDSFADITDVAVLDIAPVCDEVAVTFDGVLTPEQVAAVLSRMDSTGASDEAARAELRADRAALKARDPLRRLYDYLLGETP